MKSSKPKGDDGDDPPADSAGGGRNRPPHYGDRPRAITLGADKGYDAADFVDELREMKVRPHVAQKARWSAIDGRTTRHAGYRRSQRIRKRIEEAFGWIKTIGGLRKSRFVGRAKTDFAFTFAAAAYNLVRLPKLLEAA
jgi:IS5 family transposase